MAAGRVLNFMLGVELLLNRGELNRQTVCESSTLLLHFQKLLQTLLSISSAMKMDGGEVKAARFLD